jgi:hypothetical protein
MTAKETERQEYLRELRESLKPGDTLHCVIRYVSRSGMSRGIDVYKLHEERPDWLSYRVAKAIGERYNEKRECLSVSGCGIDMGFHVIYNLSRVLWPDGFECIGEGCPSNDHSNGDRDYTPHHHADGGYALRQKWL